MGLDHFDLPPAKEAHIVSPEGVSLLTVPNQADNPKYGQLDFRGASSEQLAATRHGAAAALAVLATQRQRSNLHGRK